MFSKIFRFQTLALRNWLYVCFVVLLVQMYLNTGTLSAYAATMEKPTVYGGYYVNYDWPQYVANYKFIIGADHQEWERGVVLRRQLMYVIGYPFLKIFGFFLGSMITILFVLLGALFFFFKFIENEFGEKATKVAMVLLCTYSGIMYWIGSPFVQNLIVPLCLGIYYLLFRMRHGSFNFNVKAVFIIGILFTGYDLLPLFAPGVLLFVLSNKTFRVKQRLVLFFISIIAIVLPPLLIRYWLLCRGADLSYGNDETYRIIIHAYFNILNQLPTWWARVTLIPGALIHCFFDSNFYALPILFLACWIPARFLLKFKMNLVERCMLVSVLILFLFNNMTPPYQGEWQMWGDWIARIYQAVYIVYVMYIVRLSAFIDQKRRASQIFTTLLVLTLFFNVLLNTGGLYASSFTSFVYSKFYKHGSPKSYQLNLNYYGARPLGFPEHYQTETK